MPVNAKLSSMASNVQMRPCRHVQQHIYTLHIIWMYDYMPHILRGTGLLIHLALCSSDHSWVD